MCLCFPEKACVWFLNASVNQHNVGSNMNDGNGLYFDITIHSPRYAYILLIATLICFQNEMKLNFRHMFANKSHFWRTEIKVFHSTTTWKQTSIFCSCNFWHVYSVRINEIVRIVRNDILPKCGDAFRVILSDLVLFLIGTFLIFVPGSNFAYFDTSSSMLAWNTQSTQAAAVQSSSFAYQHIWPKGERERRRDVNMI